jgi:hypothetical protein
LNDLEHASRKTQARHVASVESIMCLHFAFSVGVTATTQTWC